MSSTTSGLRLLLLAALSTGCTERPTAPPLSSSRSAEEEPASAGGATTLLRWNAEAQSLVGITRPVAPIATRVYALLSVAQLRAIDGAQSATSARAAEIAASGAVLTYLFPAQGSDIAAMGADDEAALVSSPSDAEKVAAGDAVGRAEASDVIARARSDGSDRVVTPAIPVGPGYWFGTPVVPQWPSVRPFVLTSGDELRPQAPPAFGSPAFATALEEVRVDAAGRTADQLRILNFWNDPAPTGHHSGHWNRIAGDLIRRDGVGAHQAARILSLLNVAMADAAIACFDAKYTYWLIRPYQVDPSISTPIGQPQHASYPSFHSCTGGAAVGVLATFFQNDAPSLSALELEMGESRIWAGLHYRFDVDTGRALGHRVAQVVLDRKSMVLGIGRDGAADESRDH